MPLTIEYDYNTRVIDLYKRIDELSGNMSMDYEEYWAYSFAFRINEKGIPSCFYPPFVFVFVAYSACAINYEDVTNCKDASSTCKEFFQRSDRKKFCRPCNYGGTSEV